jgi:hypothetical protein
MDRKMPFWSVVLTDLPGRRTRSPRSRATTIGKLLSEMVSSGSRRSLCSVRLKCGALSKDAPQDEARRPVVESEVRGHLHCQKRERKPGRCRFPPTPMVCTRKKWTAKWAGLTSAWEAHGFCRRLACIRACAHPVGICLLRLQRSPTLEGGCQSAHAATSISNVIRRLLCSSRAPGTIPTLSE